MRIVHLLLAFCLLLSSCSGDGRAFDFSLMSAYIQMNTRNMWHFVKLDHPYMFAFADWQFDHNGYPQTAR